MDLIADGGSSRMRWGRWLVLAFVLVVGVLGPSAVAQADCQKQLDFAVSEVTTDGCLATVAGSNPTRIRVGIFRDNLSIQGALNVTNVVVGHDYRSYSLTIKQALTIGLMRAGCEVLDIGM